MCDSVTILSLQSVIALCSNIKPKDRVDCGADNVGACFKSRCCWDHRSSAPIRCFRMKPG